MGIWRENKTAVSIIFGAALIAAALYLGLTGKSISFSLRQSSTVPSPTAEKAVEATSPSPELSSTETVLPTSQPTITPTPEIIYRKSDVIAALSQKTGIPEDEINFSVGDKIKKNGRILLRGGVSREGEMGGAAFFAVVDENGVKVTFAGQGVPQCSEVNPYGYPLSWADYCVDENGDTVAR